MLTAGIYGRIVDLGPEDMTLEVAPGVELRVARQAVLRQVEDAPSPTTAGGPPPDDDAPDRTGADDRHRRRPASPRPRADDRGPTAPGSPAAS